MRDPLLRPTDPPFLMQNCNAPFPLGAFAFGAGGGDVQGDYLYDLILRHYTSFTVNGFCAF
jgi:hypothetical protein